MSASGLRLALERPSPVGPNDLLTVILGAPASSIEVKARVVWTRPTAGGHELGLEFGELGSRTRAALFDLAWTGPEAERPMPSIGLGGVGR